MVEDFPSLWVRFSVWGKNSEEREEKGGGGGGGGGEGEPVDKHLRLVFCPLVIILPIICQ